MSGRVDLLRLSRAVHLDVRPTGDGRYHVMGGETAHDVDLQAMPYQCNCVDHRTHARCKHVLACQLRAGDPEIIRQLRRLIPIPRRGQRVKVAT